ncbi:FlgN-like protein [Dioscorea alata]|uniref:FlgN-like protein n=1 Tax=Dioscorea alata TaxID=55571 RepID=A0ACB7UMH1_DIOAL|nr:FlgN-like protein [Dioscorea alata]
MELQTPSGCCPCACAHCGPPGTSIWRRSMKRKLDEWDGIGVAATPAATPAAAVRVEVENEVAALREAVAKQQETIQELCAELDEERNAAASAASETMSMILRLQREKAEAQMEARQFKRFAEEKMAHDQREIVSLEDLLFRKDQALQSLSFEVQAYRHRLLSLGYPPEDLVSDPGTPGSPAFGYDCQYPPLRCSPPGDVDHEDESADLETRQGLERRIYELENMAASGASVTEKEVVEPSSKHHSTMSSDRGSCSESRTSSGLVLDNGVQNSNERGEEEEEEELPASGDHESEGDGGSDRVYTIDAVHVPVGVSNEDYGTMPNDVGKLGEFAGSGAGEETDIKKLYMRLQALEADRESMRQAIISMRTEKAQLVLLREIAQHLCKEAVPERKVVKKQQSLNKSFSIMSIVKWILSFIFWRKKAARSKYTFGQTNNNVGLLLLLDKSPRMRHWSTTMT